MSRIKSPIVLIILDGFGYSNNTYYNSIFSATKPVLDNLLKNKPLSIISASGIDVGLPHGQIGNSEVGHMNLGAGRIVYQNFTHINNSIKTGEFYKKSIIISTFNKVIKNYKTLHILGLLSNGGIHSHEDHIISMINFSIKYGISKVILHAFLDGRDTPPKSAQLYLNKINNLFLSLKKGYIATIIGRYFAMDRNNNWNRTKEAYDLIIDGKSKFTYRSSSLNALENAYSRGESDEFVKSTTIIPSNCTFPAKVEDGDAIIFMNFRSDRARQLTHAIVDTQFTNFHRNRIPKLSNFIMLTEYDKNIKAGCVFPKEIINNTLGECLANNGKTQLRIAETEKYSHITVFFSCGREAPYKGETRILVPSPKVKTYDLIPEMSAHKITDCVLHAIEKCKYDLIIVNYANPDMVGHTGVFNAAIKAVECVDHCLGRILKSLNTVNGSALITADHGNIETMFNKNNWQAHTAHTCNPVPLIYIGKNQLNLRKYGILADVAPSILTLMGLKQSIEMTGQTLIT